MHSEQSDTRTVSLSKPPVVVQILAILCFTGFAIPISIIAMGKFGVIGLFLAAFLAWQWTRLVGLDSEARLKEAVEILKPHVADAPQASGNASFDAYRNELLVRLETEQTSFDGFLDRLRAAKDKTEFDNFMTDREKSAQNSRDYAV